jgi:hypothetical protein
MSGDRSSPCDPTATTRTTGRCTSTPTRRFARRSARRGILRPRRTCTCVSMRPRVSLLRTPKKGRRREGRLSGLLKEAEGIDRACLAQGRPLKGRVRGDDRHSHAMFQLCGSRAARCGAPDLTLDALAASGRFSGTSAGARRPADALGDLRAARVEQQIIAGFPRSRGSRSPASSDTARCARRRDDGRRRCTGPSPCHRGATRPAGTSR